MKNRGFTLIELLAVIVLLALVAVVGSNLILRRLNKGKTDTFLNTFSDIKKELTSKEVLGEEATCNTKEKCSSLYDIPLSNFELLVTKDAGYKIVLTGVGTFKNINLTEELCPVKNACYAVDDKSTNKNAISVIINDDGTQEASSPVKEDVYLINKLDLNNSKTGGWSFIYSGSCNSVECKFQKHETGNYQLWVSWQDKVDSLTTKNNIDLTNVTKIIADVYVGGNNTSCTNKTCIGVTKDNVTSANKIDYTKSLCQETKSYQQDGSGKIGVEKNYEIDTSNLTGSYYINISLQHKYCGAYSSGTIIKSLYLSYK